MAQKFTVPVTIKNLSSAGSDGLTVFLDQESFARLKVEAGGRITWGSGAGAGDTNLYRDAESVLKTDDTFKAAGLYVAGTQIDTTGATNGDALVFNGTKFVSASVAGGGATLTVSDTAPEDPSLGDLWFNSTDLEIYVYYSSAWIQVTDSSSGVQELYELVDVLIEDPVYGETLVYNGTEWENGPAGSALKLENARTISLSGDVSGSASFDGTSNINLFTTVNTASVAIGELYGVNITDPLEFQTLEYNGTEWVNANAQSSVYVRNAEATTITTGTAVYLFSATGDHATVKRADNTTDATSSKTVGLVSNNILASENGVVVTQGYVDGINLSTGYASGDVLWLGKNGQFTKDKPSAPDHLVFIGVVVRATSNGIVYVSTQNGYELEELHDVKISGLSDGQFLRYNSASTVWVNDTINLGTDTAGNYMVDVSASTGLTVSHTPGEGSTATISLTGGPAFSAYPGTSQTISSGGTLVKVLFETEEFDTGSCFSSSRFTPTVAGYYQINSTVRFDGGGPGTGECMIVIFKNGGEAKRGWNSSGTSFANDFFSMSVSGLIYCNGTTDYIEIYAQQVSGGNRTTSPYFNISYFQGYLARYA